MNSRATFRYVHPAGTDTDQLDRVLGDEKLRRRTTVMVMRCENEHEVARVFRLDRKLVYRALRDHVLHGPITVVDADGQGGLVVTEEPVRHFDVDRRDEWIEYLDETLDESLPPGVAVLPASCRCGTWAISRSWLAHELEIPGSIRRLVPGSMRSSTTQ